MSFKFIVILIFLLHINLIFADCNIRRWLENPSAAESLLKITCPLLSEKMPEAKMHANKIIANEIAEKVKQSFENIAAVESYYWINGKDLGKYGTSDMMKSCNISNVTNKISNDPKCNKGKIDLLKASLGGNQTDSLASILGQKYTKLRSIDSEGNTQGLCPLAIGSTTSQLSYVMDRAAKKDFRDYMELGSFAKLKKNPIFGFITEDKEIFFKDKFIAGLSNIGKDPKMEADYVDSFLQDNDYISEVTKNLGKSCDDLFKNITDFACQNIDPIPQNDSNFKNMVENDLDPEFKVIATCHYLESSKNIKSDQHLTTNSGVDQLISSIKINLRPAINVDYDNNLREKDCEIFNCKTVALKKYPTCKSGNGPISFKDFSKYCEENDCYDSEIQFLSYLDNFEKNQNIAKSAIAISSSKSDTGKESSIVEKKSGMSSFNMNFLGLEGTLSAEGKPITAANIADKKVEFIQAGITVDDKSVTSPIKQRELQTKNTPNTPSQAPQTFVASNSNYDFHPSMTDSAVKNTPTPVTNRDNTMSSADKIQSKATQVPTNSPDNELANIRKQMEQMIDNMKGSTREKIQAITDNNLSSTSRALKENAGLNDFEARQLEDYRRRLDEWDRNLRRKDSDLSNYESDLRARTSRQDSQAAIASNGGVAGIIPSDKSSKDNKILRSQVLASGTDNTEAVVDSVDLPKVDREMLTKAGINMKSSFFIKVKYENRYVEVPVKIFTLEGKEILVPILESKNKKLNEFILLSPLFKDYITLQKKRESERAQYESALL